jgi:Protein of unknown function (DUF1501)
MNPDVLPRFVRRRFLQAGTMALFAGSAPAREARGFSPAVPEVTRAIGRATHCILVYLLGGPPQIDMWDLKPAARAEIRGPFKPIPSVRATSWPRFTMRWAWSREP